MLDGLFKSLTTFTGNLLAGWRGGRAPYPAFVDQWQTQRSPSPAGLVDDYKETAYACANINARAVASVPYHLYAVEGPTDDSAGWSFNSAPVSKSVDKYLKTFPMLSTKMMGKQVKEIYSHPILDLLEKVNVEMDGFVLFELLDLYCEITGTAYWFLEKDQYGVPTEIWPVPTQYMRLVRGDTGPLCYEYGFGNDRIELDEIIRFTFPNLRDPYGDLGWSPLRACYESNNLDSKDRAYAQAMYDNQARPDIIVAMKESVGGPERKAIERSYQRKFRQARTGGVLVLDGAADVKTLTFNSKEMEALARKAVNKVSIANAFDIPLALLETKNINRATLEGAHYQLAKHATLPRLTRFFQRINQKFVPLFDQRLFLWFDNPVPDDELMREQVRKARLDSGCVVINEIRAEDEKEPVQWGNRPWMSSSMVQVGADPDADDNDTVQAGEVPTIEVESALPAPTITALLQVVEAVSGGQISRESGVAILAASFNISNDDAETMLGTAGTGAVHEPDDNGKPDPIIVPGMTPGGGADTDPTAPLPVGQTKPTASTEPTGGDPSKDSAKAVIVMVDYRLKRINQNTAIKQLVGMGWNVAKAYGVTQENTSGYRNSMKANDNHDEDGRFASGEGGGDRGGVPTTTYGYWVSPKGEYHVVGDEQHEKAAVALIGQRSDKEKEIATHTSVLLGRGYSRVTYKSGGRQLNIQHYKPHTKEQIKALQPLVDTVRYANKPIFFDGDGGHHTVDHRDSERQQRAGLAAHGFKSMRNVYVRDHAHTPEHCPDVTRKNWRSDGGGTVEEGHGRAIPKSGALRKLMAGFFAKQKAEVLGKLKSLSFGVSVKAKWDDVPIDLSNWDEEMANAAAPVLSIIWEEGAEEAATRLGVSDQKNLYDVANPKVKDAIKKQSMKFCRETNKTTTLRIADARKQLRERMGDALANGETMPADLVNIVSDIFDGAEEWKAEQIALTESSRALHAGQHMAAKESGLVKGFKWLLSDNACPICQDIAEANPDGVGLDEAFDNSGDGGAYDITQYPPAHPSCQCTVTEILNDLSGDNEEEEEPDTSDEPAEGEPALAE